MKTDMWATGEDPNDIDIVAEEPQPGLAPAEEALEALKKSKELELQASELEEKAASLWAQAGEFWGKLSNFSKASQQPLNPQLLQSHHLLQPPLL